MRKRSLAHPPVEAVRRAFTLLELLNCRRISSVNDLHKDTGLAKSTIVRLLDSLVTLGYVTNDPRQGGYLLSSGVKSLSSGFCHDSLFVEAVKPLAQDLTKRLKIPIAVCVFDRDAMVVRYETDRDSQMSPFHPGMYQRLRRLRMLTRAVGRAYISFCPDSERNEILDVLRVSDEPEDQIVHRADEVEEIIAKVRRNGFAERSRDVEPKSSCSVSVPVFQGAEVLGAIGLSYFTSAMPRSKALELYLGPLLKLGKDVEDRIEAIRQAPAKASL
ncbi:IclR family transcriptional regulator [Bradyrhizobium macuxiense]|uniref:IclR family transcriptional regulator n=1 Tax=Bradyrhizobium macuxiense TaxID=1755647 RepID=A0A560KXB2_9BRAD|nr:helix-turn-helix domain-containing protein [Bradyrhizobium macuxiense]TWB87797.1 IclR family transcriptional regulator [Bradyrhizobium macuxiense]